MNLEAGKAQGMVAGICWQVGRALLLDHNEASTRGMELVRVSLPLLSQRHHHEGLPLVASFEFNDFPKAWPHEFTR